MILKVQCTFFSLLPFNALTFITSKDSNKLIYLRVGRQESRSIRTFTYKINSIINHLYFSDIHYKNISIIHTTDMSCQGRCGYHVGPTRCRCDTQCEVFQDCCYDYYDTCSSPVDKVNETEAINTTLFSCTPLDRDLPEMGSVLFVNKCNNKYGNKQIKERCENVLSIYSDLAERLIVEWPVSNQDGENFQNLFCALCNDQKFFDVVPWDVKYPSVSLDTSTGQKHCELLHQPGKVGKRLRYCFPSLISSCPLSSVVNVSHDYCQSFSNPLCHVNDKGQYQIYKNYYCAMCNGIDTNSLQLCDYYGIRYFSGSLQRIWQFKEHSPGKDKHVDPCTDEKNTVYDPYTNQCRPLSCPPGYMLNNKSECNAAPTQNKHIEGLCCKRQLASIFLAYDGPYNADSYAMEQDNDVLLFFQQLNRSLRGSNAKWENSHYFGAYSGKFLLQSDSVCNVADAVEDTLIRTSEKIAINRYASYMFMCTNFPYTYTDGCDNWFSGESDDFLPVTISHITEVFLHKGQYIVPKLTIHRVIYKYNEIGSALIKEDTVEVCGDIFYPLHCQMITLKKEEYYVTYTRNGSRKIHFGNVSYEYGEYIIYPDGKVQICADILFASHNNEFFTYSGNLALANVIGVPISLFGLMVTFVLRLRLCSRDRIDFHDRCILSLCTFLFIAQLLPTVSVYISFSNDVCVLSALVSHYCWLGAFSCMSVVAYDLYHLFSSSFRNKEDWESGNFCRYVAPSVVFGLPFVIVALALCLHFLHPTFEYGATAPCWISDFRCNLFAFGFPVGVSLVVNCVLYSVTAVKACRSQRRSRQIRCTKNNWRQLTTDLVLCMKVSHKILSRYNNEK